VPAGILGKGEKTKNRVAEPIRREENVIGQGNSSGREYEWPATFPDIKIIEDNPVGAMMVNKSIMIL
jgi:hypothetical protein